MNKIKVSIASESFQQRVSVCNLHLIPSDMRDVQVGFWEGDYTAGNQSQTFVAAEFQSFIKEHLKPDAQTKDRFSRLCSFFNENIKTALPETSHRVAERANSWQDEFVGRTQDICVGTDACLDADCLESLFDAA